MKPQDKETVEKLLSRPSLDALAIDVDLAAAGDPRSICCVAIAWHDGNTITGQSFFINPGEEIDPEASHGVTPEDVKDAPTFQEVAREALFPLMEKADRLVFHYAYFSTHAIAECARISMADGQASPDVVPGAVLDKPVTDTCLLSRIYQPGLPDHRTDTMAKAMGIQHNDDSAISDAVASLAAALYFQRAGMNHGPLTFHMSLDKETYDGICGSYEEAARFQNAAAASQPTEDEKVQQLAQSIRSLCGSIGWGFLYILAAIIGICLAL